MVITDAEGNLGHSQMRFGDGIIMVGGEWTDDHKSPASVGAKNTQSVHVHLTEDIDKHCARAKAAGAEIVAGACRSILRRPDLSGARSGRSHLDVRADHEARDARRGGEGSGLKIEGWV